MSAWLDQFKVGDEVEFEMALFPAPSGAGYSGACPRWDFALDLGGSGIVCIGTVISVGARSIKIRSKYITLGTWSWGDPGTDRRSGYVRLRKSAQVEPAVALQAGRATIKYAYQVVIPIPAVNKRTGKTEEIPESVMKSLLDQGERGARRAVLEWPRNSTTGDDRVLKHKVESTKIVWWFE